MNKNNDRHRVIIQDIARRTMIERGLFPDFSPTVLAELGRLQTPEMKNGKPNGKGSQIRDLRNLLWASIDNDEPRDLDQLTVIEALLAGKVKILVGSADVEGIINNGSVIDQYAHHNTTSIYTAAEIFPILPEKISTGITSLNFY